MRRVAALSLLFVALAACGDTPGASDQGAAGGLPSRAADAAAPGTIVEKSCGGGDDAGGGGACAAGFTLDAVKYHLDCTPVRADAVEATRLGGGQVQGRDVEARTIRATDRSVAVAVSVPGGDCGDGVAQRSAAWVFAYPVGAGEAAKRASVCAAGLLNEQQRAFHKCSSKVG